MPSQRHTSTTSRPASDGQGAGGGNGAEGRDVGSKGACIPCPPPAPSHAHRRRPLLPRLASLSVLAHKSENRKVAAALSALGCSVIFAFIGASLMTDSIGPGG